MSNINHLFLKPTVVQDKYDTRAFTIAIQFTVSTVHFIQSFGNTLVSSIRIDRNFNCTIVRQLIRSVGIMQELQLQLIPFRLILFLKSHNT